MHDEGIIHGDVKGVCFQIPQSVLYVPLTYPKANVLVDNDGHACLTDFGLTQVIPDGEAFSPTTNMGGTPRWMSPERLDPESFSLRGDGQTKESDCYALGMTIYEVLSGHSPFFQFQRQHVVVFKVLDGQRPERPNGAWFTDGVWEILERCWKQEPSERINVKSVLSFLEGAPPPLRSDADDQSGATSARDFSTSSVSSGVDTGTFSVLSGVSG